MANKRFEEDVAAGLEYYLTEKEQQYSRELEVMLYAYLLGRGGNTIVMHMEYFADLSPELVKQLEDNGKKLAITLAKSYKWDSWLEIQTQLDPIERPPEK